MEQKIEEEKERVSEWDSPEDLKEEVLQSDIEPIDVKNLSEENIPIKPVPK
jgi:hypothetical protein